MTTGQAYFADKEEAERTAKYEATCTDLVKKFKPVDLGHLLHILDEHFDTVINTSRLTKVELDNLQELKEMVSGENMVELKFSREHY